MTDSYDPNPTLDSVNFRRARFLQSASAIADVIQTATAIVNAIPAVANHEPGLVAAMDLPKITGKGLYRPA